MFQKDVKFDQGFGVVGEFAFDGPVRGFSAVINSANPVNNVVGRFFSRKTDGTMESGGIGAEWGILVNPKAYAAQGTVANGPLAPTLTLRNGEMGDFVSMGEINIMIDVAANQGFDIHYNKSTGELTAVTAGTAPADTHAPVPNAKISRFAQSNAAGGLAVAKLTN